MAEDAATALDLLITDQTMPGLSGLELAARCRALRPGLPVLLYSGNPGAIGADAVRCAGVAALLGKPVDAGELHDALRACLAPAAPPVR